MDKEFFIAEAEQAARELQTAITALEKVLAAK